MQSHSKLERFKVSKEELTKLGEEFNSEALSLVKNLYNTSYWILLNKKSTKKIDIRLDVKATFTGDQRVLKDIEALARSNYGEDDKGNNIELPPEIEYLRK